VSKVESGNATNFSPDKLALFTPEKNSIKTLLTPHAARFCKKVNFFCKDCALERTYIKRLEIPGLITTERRAAGDAAFRGPWQVAENKTGGLFLYSNYSGGYNTNPGHK
jgi:hypothetical protein